MSDPTNIKTPSDPRIDRLLARSALYGMLSYFLRYPEPSVDLAAVKRASTAWEQAVATLSTEPSGSDLVEPFGRLIEVFRVLETRVWCADHERAFGHTAAGRIPAYELEYGEMYSRREPQELADITGFYTAFGLRIAEGSSERPDHIAVECEFMHLLLYKEVLAIEQGADDGARTCREAALRFLADHPGRWSPAFFRKLSGSSSDLLRAVSRFAHVYVHWDARSQQVDLGPSDLPIRQVRDNEDSGCVSCTLGPDGPKREGQGDADTCRV